MTWWVVLGRQLTLLKHKREWGDAMVSGAGKAERRTIYRDLYGYVGT